MERTSRVAFGGKTSDPVRVRWGVPQGSILGPLLFVLFLSDLEEVILLHQLKHHFYADDIQLYGSHFPHESEEVSRKLTACILEIERWLELNGLNLTCRSLKLSVSGERQNWIVSIS